MPRSGPQRAGSPRRVRHLPAAAAIVDDRVEPEALLPNPGRLAPPQDVSYPPVRFPACRCAHPRGPCRAGRHGPGGMVGVRLE